MSASSGRGSPAVRFNAGLKLSRAVELSLAATITVLLVIPCIWTNRIEAGDLATHEYNAWLATQVKGGALQGLAVVPLWTNTLSDFALESLPQVLGTAWTEKLVAGVAILVFFWGTFAIASVAGGRRPWLLTPIIGMLSYGLIFELGFLNYYLSTGLCLWAVALLWQPTRFRCWIASFLLVLATLAHVMPVVWAAAVLGYLHLSRRVPEQIRLILPFAAIAALGVLRFILAALYPTRPSLDDLASVNTLAGVTGLEQFWLYGSRYLLIAAGVGFIWCVLILERVDEGKFWRDPVAQLWIVHLAAFLILPSAIQFPQYKHVLAYIPQRISLLGAVFLCMTVSRAAHGRGITRFSMLLATAFFTFLYMDNRAFATFENEITDLVQTLPPGQRVATSITDSDTRLNGVFHVIDRACIGRCFSYADYEPATGQFRIRITGRPTVVASTMAVVQEIENGQHRVTAEEAPLYSICLNEKSNEARLTLRPLRAGERTCSFSLPISPRL